MTTKCKPPKDPQLLETSSHLRFYDSCFTGTNNCSTTTCASTLQGKGPKGPLNRPDRPPHPWKRRRTRPDRSRRSRRSRTTGPRRKTTLRFRQPPVDDEGAPGPHEDERVQARSPFMLKYEDPCDGQPRADSGCGFRAGPVDEFRRLNKNKLDVGCSVRDLDLGMQLRPSVPLQRPGSWDDDRYEPFPFQAADSATGGLDSR